jgi:hypothetical protein
MQPLHGRRFFFAWSDRERLANQHRAAIGIERYLM